VGDRRKIIFFGKIIVQSAKLILYSMEMSRILMLLQKLSILQMIVSISLFAQYSHFPLTSLEFDGIESEKFPNFTSEFDNFEDITDSSIFDSGTVSDFHSDLIESSPALKISNAHSDEPTTVDIGISPIGSLNQESNFAYIQNLPDAETAISSDTPDLISDIIYFLKDLFDDDGNYSEENWLKSDYTLNGSKIPEIYDDRTSKERSIANTTVSSFWRTLVDPEFQKSVDTQTHHNHSKQGAKSSSNQQIFDDYRGDTTPSFLTTSTLSSNVQESRDFDAFDVFELENAQSLPSLQRFKRQRRNSTFDNSTVYDLVITDFASETTPITFNTENTLDGNLTGSNKMKLNIKPGGSFDSLGLKIFAYEYGVGGPNWHSQSFTIINTLNQGSYSPDGSHFQIQSTAEMDAWLGGEYNSWTWGLSGNTVTYTFTGNLPLSVAPEPSTYVMTGALLCFIGFNQKSRKSLKKIFNLLSNKLNLPTCIGKLTRTQSHS
jgi:hypothetical protein